MDCLLHNTFDFLHIQNSGLVLIIGLRIHRSQLMGNLLNLPWQYGKCQTRVQEIEICQDKGLEPTYHFSIFMHSNAFLTHF